jgi:hypothetical protein
LATDTSFFAWGVSWTIFALFEGGALSQTCTYLSYETVAQIRALEHLNRLSDEVLEDYEENAEEDE